MCFTYPNFQFQVLKRFHHQLDQVNMLRRKSEIWQQKLMLIEIAVTTFILRIYTRSMKDCLSKNGHVSIVSSQLCSDLHLCIFNVLC